MRRDCEGASYVKSFRKGFLAVRTAKALRLEMVG